MATKVAPKVRAPRGRRAKQGHLNGMEEPVVAAIEDAAEIYHDAKKARMALSVEEDQAKDNLIDKMKEHRLQLYKTQHSPPIVVVMTATSNVKTKVASDEQDEDDGEE